MRVVILGSDLVLQRAARKPEGPAHAPFRCIELLTNMGHRPAEIFRRQAFGFKKSRLSLRINWHPSGNFDCFIQRYRVCFAHINAFLYAC
jgi:hypothetical protein